MHGLTRKSGSVYLFAVIFSVLLSILASIKNVLINPDAICYLQSAETMKMGLSAAMHLCDQAKWPFYSALIYSLASVTKLSVYYSASILNGIFALISVVTFIGIIQFLTPSKRILWLAAFVILLAHQFNSIKIYIVRDHGFWAFYLLSLFFLLHYFRKPEWRTAIAWNVSLGLAILFRIEGVIFLLFLPLFVWFDVSRTWLSRFNSYFRLNILLLFVLAMVAVWVMYHSQQVFSNVGRMGEVEFQVIHGFDMVTQHFRNNSVALAQHVLSPYAESEAATALFLMLISWYIFSVAANISFIYAVLVVYAWRNKLLIADNRARLVLWAYVIINIVITTIFLIENMFLSKRYLLALSLTLMIWVPFALDRLIELRQKTKWPLVLAVFFIFVSALSGIVEFGHSKKYIRQAGDWLAVNTSETTRIYSNDYQVMYYSKHFGNTIFEKAPSYVKLDTIENGKWKQFDYVVLRFHKNESQLDDKLVKEIGQTPVQIFTNKRGGQINIYKIPH